MPDDRRTARVLALLAEHDPDMLLADGLEDAIIGVCRTAGQEDRVAYDVDKCIAILVERDGMEPCEARECLEANSFCAFVGDRTPVWIETL